jgi:hypothetical protein
MKDVMLDLETFGNGKQACVVQIGACYFDRETGEIGQTFARNVDAKSSVDFGGVIDADTIYWWLSQSREAQASILLEPRSHVVDAFNALNDFLGNAKTIWSHATFDFVILAETLKLLGIKPNFRYTAARDIRTLVDLAKITIDKTPRVGVHHNGLADAIHQVKYCVECFRKLKK